MRKIDPENFRRATRDTPREINRRILLNLVRERQPISRADLAREMGVARGTITALVNELIEDGLIREGETADAPRGRKPTLLHIRVHDRLAVGIDVRRHLSHLLLNDFEGRTVVREQFATPADPDRLVEELISRIRRLQAEHDHLGTFEGVALIVPGVVNGDGRLMNAPTLRWTNVDLGPPLQEALHLPVYIERDAVACALARIWLADDGELDLASFVYLTIAEGVGTGLVVNGQVVRGSQFAAGEFGHVPLDLDGPRCSCGSTGCLEAYTSDSTTVSRYLAGRGTPPGEGGLRTTVSDIVERAHAGDQLARSSLTTTGRYIGLGLAAVINALNPAALIVGGEIALAWTLIEPAIRKEVVSRTLTQAAGETPIVPETADGEQRLKGATALVMAPLFAAPRIA